MSDLNYYIRYKKTGRAKYISHLDMVRVFNRVFRRGSIPIAYSEGFNPHPKISFALPLSVFYESECEIMLFSLTEEMSEAELKERFNSVMPEGLYVTEVVHGKCDVKHLTYCLYNVYCKLCSEADLKAFTALSSMVVPKKTKSGIKDTDIRCDITDIRIKDDHYEMLLSAGSSANLKPDVVMKAMEKYISGYHAGDAEYLRKAIYTNQMEEI